MTLLERDLFYRKSGIQKIRYDLNQKGGRIETYHSLSPIDLSLFLRMIF